MKEGVGVDLSVSAVTTPSGNKKIFVGYDIATKAGFGTDGITSENGYIIKYDGANIYIYGTSEFGTLNGVYAFLNCVTGLEIFTDDCYTFSCGSGENVLDGISYSSNFAYGCVFNLDGETRIGASEVGNTEYGYRMGMDLGWYTFAGGWHNEGAFAASAYYSGSTSNGHISLAKDNYASAAEVANYLYSLFYANSEITKVSFSINDDLLWNTDAESADLYDRYGIYSYEYTVFMNLVAEALNGKLASSGRTIELYMLAYNNSMNAPAVPDGLGGYKAVSDEVKFYSGSNVALKVIYAPISANWYKPLTDSINSVYEEEFRKWAAIAGPGNIYFWQYSTFTDSYLTPFDSINAISANYRLACELGAIGLLDEGQFDNEVCTDWGRLKIYLKHKLSLDPYADVDSLISDFANAYFGVAAADMLQFFTAQRTFMSSVFDIVYQYNVNSPTLWYGAIKAGVMLNLGTGQKTFWGGNSSELLKWNGYISNAYAAALSAKNSGEITQAQYDVIEKRIKLESISVRFIILKVFPSSAGSDTMQLLYEDCVEVGITMAGENSDIASLIA